MMSKRRRADAPAMSGKTAGKSGTAEKGRKANPVATPAAERGVSQHEEAARWDKGLLLVLLVVPMLFNALTLYPELVLKLASDNDNGLHYLMIKGASDALSRGQNPLDFWAPQLELGFPQFLYYQNFPHLVVVALHRLLLGSVSLLTLFNVTRYVLMVGMPVTVFWSLRQMRFSMTAAAISAAVASLISGQVGYGLEYNSYTWIGRGLYTQLWAVHLSFLAMACLSRVFQTGRGYVAAVATLAMLAMSHYVYAYMMAITGVIVLLAGSERAQWKVNFARLAIVGVSAIAVSSFMLVPFLVSGSKYLAIPPGIKSADFDALTPITSVLNGSLMDNGRMPILTLLTMLGIVVAVMAVLKTRQRQAVFALSGFLAWLVLYQVRPTSASWIGRVLHYDGHLIFRFVGTLEMFAILLMGLAGEWIWNAITRMRLSLPLPSVRSLPKRVALGPVIALVVLLGVLVPVINERGMYYSRNRQFMVESARAITQERNLATILDTVAAHPVGRAYVGNRHNWGSKMNVGPLLKAYDVLRFRGIEAVTLPFQGFSLNTAMIWDFKDNDPAKYDLLDVRYAIGPTQAPPPAFFTAMLRTDRYTLYRVPTSGIAMFGAVTARRAVATQAELTDSMLAWSHGAGPAAHQFIRWDYMQPAAPLSAPPACPDGGHILSESEIPGDLSVRESCTAAATLVLKVSYHPNWRVTVDDRPADMYMVSPSFMAVDVPAGEHTVHAVYHTATSRVMLMVFGFAVLLLVILLRNRLDWLPSRFMAMPDSVPDGNVAVA